MNKVRSTLLRFTITSVALAAAGAAHGGDKAPANNGAMTFPNVRVVTASPGEVAKAAKPRAANAQVAVVDPVTGALRAPTAEELSALLTPLGSSTTTTETMATAESMGTPIVNAAGVQGFALDEGTASYAVVHKHADGTVEHVCVDDAHSAKSTLAAPAAKKEVKHVR